MNTEGEKLRARYAISSKLAETHISDDTGGYR